MWSSDIVIFWFLVWFGAVVVVQDKRQAVLGRGCTRGGSRTRCLSDVLSFVGLLARTRLELHANFRSPDSVSLPRAANGQGSGELKSNDIL